MCIHNVKILYLLFSLCMLGNGQSAARHLNNLVIELENVKSRSLPISFVNSRDGWVFCRVTTEQTFNGHVSLASEQGIIHWTLPVVNGVSESMRWMGVGRYQLLPNSSAFPVVDVVIRSVPELHYCRYPSEPKIPAFRGLDWQFLKTYVLSNINTIVGTPTPESDPHIEEWTSQGGKWINYCHLPMQKHITGLEVYEYWSQRMGFNDARLSGIIVDEFQGREHPLYPAWTEAVKRLGASPLREGRAFYGYCGGPGMFTRPQTRELVRTVFSQDFFMAYERYLHEEPTRESMQVLMDELLGNAMTKWAQTFPDCQRRMVIVLGLFSQGFGLNVHPNVDFKVHMDVQMQYIASHPVFQNIFGVQWWTSDFSDDETLQWLGQLFRHYAIEGKTELFSTHCGFAYVTNHIINPDFSDGFRGWTVMPASIDSMEIRYKEYYARMQGRYWHRNAFPDEPPGNTYLWMKRQSNKPNVALQILRRLIPGQLYSAKMISADFLDITNGVSQERLHGVSLVVKEAEVIPEKSFQTAYPSQQCEPFLDKPAWFNLHRVVFRAQKDTAVLAITDWPQDISQKEIDSGQVMINFIEVQPYFSLEFK